MNTKYQNEVKKIKELIEKHNSVDYQQKIKLEEKDDNIIILSFKEFLFDKEIIKFMSKYHCHIFSCGEAYIQIFIK